MAEKETIEYILTSEIEDDVKDVLKDIIADDFDNYLREESFTKIPIKWLIDITMKERVSDEQIIALIEKMIEQGNENAILLINSLKIVDKNIEKCYKILSYFKGNRLFDIICKSRLQEPSPKIENEPKQVHDKQNIQIPAKQRPEQEQKQILVEQQDNQIRVSKVSLPVDEETLRELFGKCGEIPSDGITMVKSKNGRKCVVFITFETHEGVKNAMKLNHKKFGNGRIQIAYNDAESVKIIKSRKGNLLIKRLDKGDPTRLYDEFSKYGEIISYKISKSGIGYVQFLRLEDAVRARADLVSFEGAPITIEKYNPEENK